MTQRVQAGLQFMRGGKLSSIGHLRLTHQNIEIHSEDGNLALISPEQFRREVVDGDIQMLVLASDGKLRPVSNDWRERETDCSRERRSKRSQVLNFLEQERQHGHCFKDIVSSVQTFCDQHRLGKAPSERTLRYWRSLARGHESMLSPAWNRCGNRHQGPDTTLLTAIREVVDVAMGSTDLFTLSKAWELVVARYDELWQKSNCATFPPSHSIRKLKNFLRAMPWSDLIKLRMDGRTARSLTRTAVHVHTTGVYWDCVEMDATVLDIFVRDEDGNQIGRPVLYVAIDIATGYIVGLHLTIQSPSTQPFVDCIRFMYFPKPDGFDKKYDIKNRIEAFGKPIRLRVDNGSEFIGSTATELVRHLYGDTARCQPYKPEEKPYVERFNGILKTYILTQRGATTSSVTGKARLLRKGEELYLLDELAGVIFRFVYDKYALEFNELRSLKSGKAAAPLDIWRAMSATFPQLLPVQRDVFERSLAFKHETRSLGFDGISFDGWKYHSDELAKVYRNSGPRKCKFFYSELDAMCIYVDRPEGGEPVRAFEKTLEGTSVDRETARQLKKKIRADGKELNRRTFPHALAEFRTLQADAKRSRSPAKQAKINDLLNAAEEHIRPTMPASKTTFNCPPPSSGVQEMVSVIGTAPRGRKMGEKR